MTHIKCLSLPKFFVCCYCASVTARVLILKARYIINSGFLMTGQARHLRSYLDQRGHLTASYRFNS